MVAVAADRLAELQRPLRPPRRRGRPTLGAFTGDGVLVVRHGGDGRARSRHRVPARRPAAAADDRRCCRRPTATPATAAHASTIRRRRCWRCSPIRTSPRRRRSIRRYDHEILGATVVRPLVGVDARRPRRRRRARRSRPTRTASPIGIGVNPWYGAARPRARWRTPSSTRRSATSSPSAPTPTRSPCSTTSRGATRAGRRRSASSSPPSTAAATRPSPTGAPFVSGKDSLNNEYLGTDGAAPRRAADAGDHRRRPRARRRRVRHARPEAAPATCSCWSASRERVRRQPPRHGARCTGRARRRAGARSRRTRRATDVCIGRSATGRRRAPATTSARAGWPSRSPRCASPAGSASPIDALPHADLATGAVRESIGRFVVEVAPDDVERFARRCSATGHASSARSPTTPISSCPAGRARRRPARRRFTARVPERRSR